MEIFNKKLFKKLIKNHEITEREFELLELLLICGHDKKDIANIMDISETELYRKLGRLEKKFPGLKESIGALRSVGELRNKPKVYLESDLPSVNGQKQRIGDLDSIYQDDEWQKIIRKF